MARLNLSLSTVMEFFRALGKLFTYNIWKNSYVIFGVLWGVPVPIVTIGISLYCKKIAPSLGSIIDEIINHPFQIFFLLHPLIFGIVFGVMGTISTEKEKEKLRFENSLIQKNAELEDANKRLKEFDTLKDNFLSMVSHELKTPLATIQGYITFIKMGKLGELSTEQLDALGIVEEQSDHLNELIGELVDLSRIESGRFQVSFESSDLVDVFDKVADSLDRAFEEKGVRLERNFSRGIPPVTADPRRMAQVFTNLLENALKFTPKGGKVIVEALDKPGSVQFSVLDTGIGMSRDEVDKIFDKFYQVDSSSNRKYGGCGLGLTIARHIVELHEGARIWAQSEPGKGSRFYITLKKKNQQKENL